MSFKGRNNPTNPLFKKLEIMKLEDILLYNNCIFAYDQINENLPENFKDFFLTAENQHNYNTRGTTNKTNKNDNQFNNIWSKLNPIQGSFNMESNIKKRKHLRQITTNQKLQRTYI